MNNSLHLFTSAIKDYLIRVLPISPKEKYDFAFLVHARNFQDIYRKYPFLKKLPNNMVGFLSRHMWPVVVSEVTGLRSLKDGHEIKGLVIGFTMTAEQMMSDRKQALKKIIDSAALAKKKGASIIGLGGLTSSLSKGGLEILNKVHINLTTGHAYTAFTVASNVLRVVDMFNLSKKEISVAIVGASGSIGATTTQLLARYGFQDFILIEIERKIHKLEEIGISLKKLNPKIQIKFTHNMAFLRKADIIVTATNAPDVVVYNEHLKRGAIIVDDAQPSDIAPEVLDNKDVMVIEAGVVNTPGINNHFNFGLKNREDNFCCMCEIMILVANGWNKHYVVNRANINLIDKIVSMGEGLKFKLAEMQNFKELIRPEKIENIKKILSDKTN